MPPADDAGPPLPLMFAISSHPGRVEADDSPGPSGIVRQVDLVNNSDDLLTVTVVSVNLPTQEQTRAALMVPPHAQAHVGAESGLRLEPGYQVTLRSRGYQELTQTVD